MKKRNTQDFPAAGLRWPVQFRDGDNRIRVVARKAGVEVVDEISFVYQTAKWGPAAKLELHKIAGTGGVVVLEARIFDVSGVLCLDSCRLRFGLAGDGMLLDNLGTSTRSREVEVYNGRAQISVRTNRGSSHASVTSKGIPSALLAIS